MELIKSVIDFIIHIDIHLGDIISNYGVLTYLILFFIIFIETGVVIMPFLPGDSLIFAASAFAAIGKLNIFIIFFICLFAAVLGDTVNFEIGKFFSNKNLKNYKLINEKHVNDTEKFFDKYGGLSIVIGRFVPIIRTFVPFVAGFGRMKYFNFIKYNIIGGFLWVTTFTILGYFFGNIPIVQKHFSLVVIAIIIISVIPAIVTFIKGLKEKNKTTNK